MNKKKYIRIKDRSFIEQLKYEEDLNFVQAINRALKNSNLEKDKVMELSLHTCIFGQVLIGTMNDKTLQAVEFGPNAEECYRSFYNKWNKSGIEIKERTDKSTQFVDSILNSINTGKIDSHVPTDFYSVGTYFQRQVWQELKKIPIGETRTYLQMARMLNRGSASCRAIGNACHANPIALFVPCHRVIRSDGKTGGFKWGEDLKKELLNREGVFVK